MPSYAELQTATDIDGRALAAARVGRYTEAVARQEALHRTQAQLRHLLRRLDTTREAERASDERPDTAPGDATPARPQRRSQRVVAPARR